MSYTMKRGGIARAGEMSGGICPRGMSRKMSYTRVHGQSDNEFNGAVEFK